MATVDLTSATSATKNLVLVTKSYTLPESVVDTFTASSGYSKVLSDGTEISIPANAVPVSDSSETITINIKPGCAEEFAQASGTRIDANFDARGDAFRIEPTDPIIPAFQAAYKAITGTALPMGGKPFVDDGNTLSLMGGLPALTHGPAATGAHTLQECVSLDGDQRSHL